MFLQPTTGHVDKVSRFLDPADELFVSATLAETYSCDWPSRAVGKQG
jgi:hypothetical protein